MHLEKKEDVQTFFMSTKKLYTSREKARQKKKKKQKQKEKHKEKEKAKRKKKHWNSIHRKRQDKEALQT